MLTTPMIYRDTKSHHRRGDDTVLESRYHK